MSDRLTARSAEHRCPMDLLQAYRPGAGFFFERGGEGFVAFGAAATAIVEPGPDHVARAAAAARRLLESVDVSGDGPPPLAVGAIPFDGDAPARLVVPQWTVRRADGRLWEIAVSGGAEPEPAESPGSAPTIVATRNEPDPEDYEKAVAAALEMIERGDLSKVVLARSLVLEAAEPLDKRAILARLRRADPNAYVFATNGLVGASPELLVARQGREVLSRPLAGTIRRGATAAEDQQAAARLAASAKEQWEHRIVVDSVRGALEPLCDDFVVDARPEVWSTSRVLHLATTVRGRLREAAPSALELAARLHPSPAVCGAPSAVALDAIRSLEPEPRGLYGGLAGWVDAAGDGEWAVAIRCAEIHGRVARLSAGAGIVAGSVPARERAETDAKLEVVLRALGVAHDGRGAP